MISGRAAPGRLGLWLIGARGNVAVSVAAGIAALQQGVTASVGLCTESPLLAEHEFKGFSDILVGGHEIRAAAVGEVLTRLSMVDRVIDPAISEQVRQSVEAYDARIAVGMTDATAQERVSEEIREFASDHGLERIVVVNLASTEARQPALPTTEGELRQAAKKGELPASSLYALASLDAGAAYVNFTPSTGATGPVFDAMATERGSVHAGRDGKTGETLLKAALLPMFAARNLRVESWFGQNILGNADGRTLREPEAKSAKQSTKSALVEGVLGYQPDTHVGIDYVEPLGDWKVAWDHVLFRGFMGTQMNLQLTWQGADSILAAPLVIDLARICDFAMRRGDSGLLPALAFFFKEPLGSEQHGLMAQYEELLHFLRGT